LARGKVDVAVETNKNNRNRIPTICEQGVTEQWVVVSTITSGIHPTHKTRKEKVMKVGFAVQTNEGMESKVYDHFGSAPAFIIVDTEGKEVLTVNNKDLHHVHGACNPIMALDGKAVNAMIVGGIGAGALTKLNALGIKVYGAGASTVKENLSLLSEAKLQELSVHNSCRSHQGGCGH
jgi:ArsR family transcriptional regulator